LVEFISHDDILFKCLVVNISKHLLYSSLCKFEFGNGYSRPPVFALLFDVGLGLGHEGMALAMKDKVCVLVLGFEDYGLGLGLGLEG